MRRTAVLGIALLALVGVAAASARDPRSERVRLRSADVRAAKASLFRLNDLVAGWKPYKSTSHTSFECPAEKTLNLSRFVVTGRAEASFQHTSGAQVGGITQIMASRRHAIDDFVESSRVYNQKCFRYLFEHEFGEHDPNVDVAVGRAEAIHDGRYGERSLHFQIDATMSGPGGALVLYMDVVVFQKARAVAAVFATSARRPIDAAPALARLMASRL